MLRLIKILVYIIALAAAAHSFFSNVKHARAPLDDESAYIGAGYLTFKLGIVERNWSHKFWNSYGEGFGWPAPTIGKAWIGAFLYMFAPGEQYYGYFPYDFSKPLQWNIKNGKAPPLNAPSRMWARRSVAVAGLAVIILISLFLWIHFGWLYAVVFTIIASRHPLVRNVSSSGLVDPFPVAFLALILPVHYLFHRKKHPTEPNLLTALPEYAIYGFIVALAFSSKVNGLNGIFIIGMLAVYHFLVLAARKKWLYLVICPAAAGIVFISTCILVNPFFQKNTVTHWKQFYGHWTQSIELRIKNTHIPRRSLKDNIVTFIHRFLLDSDYALGKHVSETNFILIPKTSKTLASEINAAINNDTLNNAEKGEILRKLRRRFPEADIPDYFMGHLGKLKGIPADYITVFFMLAGIVVIVRNLKTNPGIVLMVIWGIPMVCFNFRFYFIDWPRFFYPTIIVLCAVISLGLVASLNFIMEVSGIKRSRAH